MILKGFIALMIFFIVPELIGLLILKFFKEEKNNLFLGLVIGTFVIAMIKDGSHSMYIELVAADASLKFTTMAANSYDPYYKNSDGEYSRSNLTKLCVITDGKVTDFEAAVVFRVLHKGETTPVPGTLYDYIPMEQWKLEK